MFAHITACHESILCVCASINPDWLVRTTTDCKHTFLCVQTQLKPLRSSMRNTCMCVALSLSRPPSVTHWHRGLARNSGVYECVRECFIHDRNWNDYDREDGQMAARLQRFKELVEWRDGGKKAGSERLDLHSRHRARQRWNKHR